MHFNRFDLNLLVALDALLEEKSVSRAAERLFVTQPAMSGSLQRLRERFNDPLLVRVGRSMELTPRARALISPVREVLLRIQSTLENEPEFYPFSVKRTFRLAVSDYVATVLMPSLMQALEQEAPGISLNLVPVGDLSLDELKSGRIDLLIRALVDPLHEARQLTDDIQTRDLFVDDWVCATCRNHPELQQLTELSRELYIRLPHLALNLGRNSPMLEELARAQMSLNLDIRATAPNFLSLVMMLPGSRYLVMLPRRLALQVANNVPLSLWPAPVSIPVLQERMLWHVRDETDSGHHWLRQRLAILGAGLMAPGPSAASASQEQQAALLV